MKDEDIKCVMGEGMPVYRDPFEKGRLIIQFSVKFPPSGFLTPEAVSTLESVLPPRQVSLGWSRLRKKAISPPSMGQEIMENYGILF